MADQSDQDRLLDHEYDGIREYDNPMPRWWLATLWGTVLFSVVYVINVGGVGNGKGRIADYEAEMKVAAELAAKHDPMAGLTNEAMIAVAGDPAKRALGQATFTTMCSSCHVADGGGLIGPNLTDRYWLHGGQPIQIMKTVVEGVPAKGMPAWGKILKPDQLTAVAAYVTTLRGTTPKNPKAAQGVLEDSVTTKAP